jgi:hypothetical protein
MICLLSYPRSGNHLARFFIELLSERPTRGCSDNKSDVPIHTNRFSEPVPFKIATTDRNNFIADKHHSVPTGSYQKLVFLVRNPREALIRFHGKRAVYPERYQLYFDLISYYQQFEGPKKIFYYEDLLENKESFIRELYEFLEIDKPDKLDYCLEHADKLYQLNLTATGRSWAGNKSNMETTFHYKGLTGRFKRDFDRYLEQQVENSQLAFLREKYQL